MVALVLRGGGQRARAAGRSQQIQCGGRPYLVRRARAVAAIRARLPEYLPAAGAAARSQHRDRSMLDLMPAPGLIFNEWDKHGTCSGLGARAYFETIRKARAVVKIPDDYLQSGGAQDDRARRCRGGLRQGQSRPDGVRHRGDLRPHAAQRSAHLHEQGAAVPRLPGDRSSGLPARSGDDAAAERWLILDDVIPGWCVSTRPQMRNCASGNLEILRCAIAHHSLRLRTPRNLGYFQRPMS